MTGGGGSIQDMNNRIRDNRALLGRRKMRFIKHARLFDKKVEPLIGSYSPPNNKHYLKNQASTILEKVRKEERFFQIVTAIVLISGIAIATAIIIRFVF